MKVDIMEHLDDGTQRRIATFQWRDGELNCDNPVLWKHLMNSNGGVIIGARGKRYYPRDGVDYLRNLKYQFAGPYLFAHLLDDPPAVPPPPLPASSSTLTGGIIAPVATVAGGAAVEPAPGPARPTGRGPLPPKAGRDVRRPPREPARPAEQEGDLSRQALENICGGVFRLSLALRGLALTVAHGEADQLLRLLAELVQIDFNALKRAYEAREEYLELRYQPPSRLNYPKVWERLTRTFQNFLEVLEAGDLAASLWPLFLVREGLVILPEHRSEWAQGNGVLHASSDEVCGTSKPELAQSWETVAAPAFRRKGLSSALLEEVYAQATEPFARAVAAFQQANFGQAESEARAALRIDPGYTEARLLLGDVLRRLDRVPEALAELQHTVELEHLVLRLHAVGRPAYYLRMTRARICIGRVLLGVGRIREAAEQLEKGLESLDWLTRKTPPEALDELERQQWKEESVTIHRLLEPVYRALGETERADHHRKKFSNP